MGEKVYFAIDVRLIKKEGVGHAGDNIALRHLSCTI